MEIITIKQSEYSDKQMQIKLINHDLLHVLMFCIYTTQ